MRRKLLLVMAVTAFAAGPAFLISASAEPVFQDIPMFPLIDPPSEEMGLESALTTISGVPEYVWWYGCSPTAAGMMIGWWDTQGGKADLFEGDASVWYGDGNSGTRRMVASQEHIDAGAALGYTYGSYQNHTANCIADFFQTQDGGTYRSKMAAGFEDFCYWDDPTTATFESYDATATTHYTSSGWDYAAYCAEIDAGRPVHLGLASMSGGHSVTGVGYDDTGGKQNYLCWTTWSGWGLQSWEWENESQSGFGYDVYGATYLDIGNVTPELSSGALILVSAFPMGLVWWRRRRS